MEFEQWLALALTNLPTVGLAGGLFYYGYQISRVVKVELSKKLPEFTRKSGGSYQLSFIVTEDDINNIYLITVQIFKYYKGSEKLEKEYLTRSSITVTYELNKKGKFATATHIGHNDGIYHFDTKNEALAFIGSLKFFYDCMLDHNNKK